MLVRLPRTVTATIAVNGTESGEIDLEGFAVVGLIIPTQVSANITFKVAEKSGGTFVALKDKDGSTVTIIAGTGAFAVGADDLSPLSSFRWIKVVSSATQTSAEEYVFMLKG